MTEKIRSGGSYCEVCKKCLSPPRLRKNFIPEWWTVCEECQPDVLDILFKPTEDSIRTAFKIDHKDIPRLIEDLCKSYSLWKARGGNK